VVVIGIGLVFVGYSLGLWAYCGVRGYNVTLGQVFSTKGPPNSTSGAAKAATQAAQQAQQKQSKTAPGPLPTPTGLPSSAQQYTQLPGPGV
jgi:hypothetical protein